MVLYRLQVWTDAATLRDVSWRMHKRVVLEQSVPRRQQVSPSRICCRNILFYNTAERLLRLFQGTAKNSIGWQHVINPNGFQRRSSNGVNICVSRPWSMRILWIRRCRKFQIFDNKLSQPKNNQQLLRNFTYCCTVGHATHSGVLANRKRCQIKVDERRVLSQFQFEPNVNRSVVFIIVELALL